MLAPNFTLIDQYGNTHKLSDYIDKAGIIKGYITGDMDKDDIKIIKLINKYMF